MTAPTFLVFDGRRINIDRVNCYYETRSYSTGTSTTFYFSDGTHVSAANTSAADVDAAIRRLDAEELVS